ncbi:MAG: hypothetical protein AAF989_17250, partial [Planctomycetota bacterium]
MLGHLNPNAEYEEVVAPPGFVVGGIRVRPGIRVHAIQLLFRRWPNDSANVGHESSWYGGKGSGPLAGELLGNDGRVVRGIKCSHNLDINQISLVMDPQE